MKLWATSCLHLRPGTVDATLERVARELEGATKPAVSQGGDYALSDVLLLVGDIVDATPGWAKCASLLEQRVPLFFRWIRGNNDYALRPYTQRAFFHLYGTAPNHIVGYGNTGVNVAGPMWDRYHDIATKDQEQDFYSKMITDCTAFGNAEHIQVIATHYPFMWFPFVGAPPKVNTRVRDLFANLPNLKHIVFGHVHADEYGSVSSNAADLVPKKIVVDGREIQVHLVSDHRERLIHPIMEIA